VAVVAAGVLHPFAVVQPLGARELGKAIQVPRRDVAKVNALLERSPDGDGLARPRRRYNRGLASGHRRQRFSWTSCARFLSMSVISMRRFLPRPSPPSVGATRRNCPRPAPLMPPR